MSTTQAKHVPDITKIPSPLQSLPWSRVNPDSEWTNGSELLVAVPICGSDNHRRIVDPREDWHYEFSVVDVQCDEGLFRLDVNGEAFDWEWSDIDWYVGIRK